MTTEKQLDKKLKQIERKEKQLDKKMEKVEELSRKEKLKRKAKHSAKSFNKELKKSTNTAIVAAFSFLIALVWRDAISEYINKLTEMSPMNGKLISALIVTFICVLGIVLVTKLLKVEDDKKN